MTKAEARGGKEKAMRRSSRRHPTNYFGRPLAEKEIEKRSATDSDSLAALVALLAIVFCLSVVAIPMWLLTDYPLLACYVMAFGVELLLGMSWGTCCGDWWY